MDNFRRIIRNLLFYCVRKVAKHDLGRAALADGLNGLLSSSPEPVENIGAPYNLAQCATSEDYNDVIFLTGRYRSGSTLLWNLFRHCDGVTAYYEPFNRRRWFDSSHRGERVDGTHRGVEDYWAEYQGLDHLDSYFREEWTRRDLYLDALAWKPEMRAYIQELISSAVGRPVLQFNRIDFRLGWIRRQFPGARIVHIFRHPRDQWCSTLLKTEFGPGAGSIGDFEDADKFYLRSYVNDLQYFFPFLREDAHPYRHFYYLWKLSYIYSMHYADISIRFEDLLRSASDVFSHVLGELDVKCDDFRTIEGIINAPQIDRWKGYSDADWFVAHETHCEAMLGEFFAQHPADHLTNSQKIQHTAC